VAQERIDEEEQIGNNPMEKDTSALLSGGKREVVEFEKQSSDQLG